MPDAKIRISHASCTCLSCFPFNLLRDVYCNVSQVAAHSLPLLIMGFVYVSLMSGIAGDTLQAICDDWDAMEVEVLLRRESSVPLPASKGAISRNLPKSKKARDAPIQVAKQKVAVKQNAPIKKDGGYRTTARKRATSKAYHLAQQRAKKAG